MIDLTLPQCEGNNITSNNIIMIIHSNNLASFVCHFVNDRIINGETTKCVRLQSGKVVPGLLLFHFTFFPYLMSTGMTPDTKNMTLTGLAEHFYHKRL